MLLNAGIVASSSTTILWTPTQLTTALWLDAADNTTLSTSGDQLLTWGDKSQNATNIQTFSASRPVVTPNGLNGYNTISFGGASGMRQNPASPALNFSSREFAIFGVIKSGRTNQESEGLLSVKRPGVFDVYHSLLERRFSQFSSTIGDGSNATFDSARFRIDGYINTNTSNFNIIGFTCNSSELLHYFNSVQQSTATETGSLVQSNYLVNLGSNLSYATIGARFNSFDSTPQSFFLGEYAELVVLPSVPSTDDRQRIKGYFAHKWGLTANLPSGHPYKTIPPTL